MATSIGQYTPVFLPGEHPLTEKPDRPQSTGLQIGGYDQSDPACIIDTRRFACGGSALVRGEHERGATAWLVGTLVAPSVQGHRLPPPQELRSYQSLYSGLL